MFGRHAQGGSGKLSPAQVARRWPPGHPAHDSMLYQWLLTRDRRQFREQWAPNLPRLRGKVAA